jgi:hypothetical protein
MSFGYSKRWSTNNREIPRDLTAIARQTESFE